MKKQQDLYDEPHKSEQRKELNRLMEEYLARGGEIRRPPLTLRVDQYNKQSWMAQRDRQREAGKDQK